MMVYTLYMSMCLPATCARVYACSDACCANDRVYEGVTLSCSVSDVSLALQLHCAGGVDARAVCRAVEVAHAHAIR
jgi:hypothetical protein